MSVNTDLLNMFLNLKQNSFSHKFVFLFLLAFGVFPASAQETDKNPETQKAEAIIQKAVQKLGGDRYLQVKTIVGRGNFNQFAENGAASFSSFVDTIVFPDKERTEFKSSSLKTIQTNVGDAGWYYDSTNKSISDQTPEQIAAFKQSIRTSLDNLLRGNWRKENAKLEYIGRREASLGKRNEAIKLIYPDNFAVEFEFSAQDGTPAKVLYKRKNADGEETKEETRFAQFIEVNGVFAPFILDFYRNGKLSGRANYSTIEFNTPVPDSFFTKPADVKKIK